MEEPKFVRKAVVSREYKIKGMKIGAVYGEKIIEKVYNVSSKENVKKVQKLK